MKTGAVIMASMLLTLQTACSTTATVHRVFGPAYEGRVHGSDATSVNVGAANGLVYRVDGGEITDIDHPGNVHLTVGGVLLGLGTALAVSATSAASSSERNDQLGAAIGYAAISVPFIVYGSWVWARSRGAARAFAEAPRPVVAVPSPMPTLPAPPRPPPPSGVPRVPAPPAPAVATPDAAPPASGATAAPSPPPEPTAPGAPVVP